MQSNFEWLPRRELAAGRRRWAEGPGKRVLLNPGARWLNKRWPAEYYGKLAALLARYSTDTQIAVLGGTGDSELAAVIERAAPGRVQNFSGKTSLPELIELIRECDLMVTNDTGPMHIAAALRKPIVPLFGPTEPRRTGPYGQVDRVIQTPLSCVPCMRSDCRNPIYMACLHSITPEAVLDRVCKQLF
jgi:lipopolysaccharide heptosyltransferase II